MQIRSSLIIAILLVAAACGASPQKPVTASPPVVEVVRPDSGPVVERIEAVGTVQHRHEFTLSFRLAGVVTSVRGEEGDRIRAGQIVATLDPTSFDAALARNSADVERARRNFDRSKQLFDKGFVSNQHMQDRRTELQSARAAERIAVFDRRGATLAAPASGFVLERLVQRDEVVQPGQAILRLADSGSALIVRAALSDRTVAGLKVGAAAVVDDGLASAPVVGRVSRIGERADEATGSVYVEVLLPANASFRTGQVVKLSFERGAAETFQRIPAIALLEAGGAQAAVLIYDAKRKVAVRRTVRFGGLRDGFALVADLPNDAAVITSGGAGLTNGQPVRVVDFAGAGS